VKVIIDLCVIPLGVGTSVSEHVAACHRILATRGLDHRLHAYGTNIEGPWDDVMAAVKACHEKMHEMGAPRVSSTLRVGTRNDRDQSMKDKIESVRAKLDQS